MHGINYHAHGKCCGLALQPLIRPFTAHLAQHRSSGSTTAHLALQPLFWKIQKRYIK